MSGFLLACSCGAALVAAAIMPSTPGSGILLFASSAAFGVAGILTGGRRR